jgi:hypothetical protein
VLPLTGTEFVTGTEAKSETNELHAPEKANPDNVQAFTVCFAIDYQPGENHVIDKPAEYDFWKNFVPKMTAPWSGRLLDLSYSNPKTLEPKKLGFIPKVLLPAISSTSGTTAGSSAKPILFPARTKATLRS